MTSPINVSKENVVTMYDERIAELEHLLMEAEGKLAVTARKYEDVDRQAARLEQQIKAVRSNAHDETSMLSGIIYFLLSECGLEQHHLDQAIAASSYTDMALTEALEYHEAVPEGWLSREYYVTVTVPVSVCVTVRARNEGDAEEMAQDEIDSNGLDNYDMDYNLYYDAEYSVEEA